MAKILIVYGTKEGQTQKIANRIADVVRTQGYDVLVTNASEIHSDFDINDYSSVIVGASIHLQSYASSVRHFIQRYKSDLERLPSAFFSVSLTDATTEYQSQIDNCLNSFYNKTGWHPKTVGRFAGALAYTKYGFFTRHMMKYIAKKGGYSVDTSQDHDYTNWEQVEKFTNDFVIILKNSNIT